MVSATRTLNANRRTKMRAKCEPWDLSVRYFRTKKGKSGKMIML